MLLTAKFATFTFTRAESLMSILYESAQGRIRSEVPSNSLPPIEPACILLSLLKLEIAPWQ